MCVRFSNSLHSPGCLGLRISQVSPHCKQIRPFPIYPHSKNLLLFRRATFSFPNLIPQHLFGYVARTRVSDAYIFFPYFLSTNFFNYVVGLGLPVEAVSAD